MKYRFTGGKITLKCPQCNTMFEHFVLHKNRSKNKLCDDCLRENDHINYKRIKK